MPKEIDDVLGGVGPRLRTLRQDAELTLADLATTTGISLSTLSRLESGQRRPTLELLLPLARAHGIPLDELVEQPADEDPRVRLKAIRRHGMTMLPLTRRAGGLQAYRLTIATSRRTPDPQTHDGYDWIYVLHGQLRLVLGDHDLVLEPGEAAEFDTRVPHWFGTSGKQPVEALSIFSREGERIHVRARSTPRNA